MWWFLSLVWAAPTVDLGWYLWETGQEEAAAEVADELGEPNIEGRLFQLAMMVARGDGPLAEAQTKLSYSLQPLDAQRRIEVAWVEALVHSEAGSWCENAKTMLVPIVEGEDAVVASLVNRQRLLRCVGNVEHAGAEFRRLKEHGFLAKEEATFAGIERHYIKSSIAEDLEQVIDMAPQLMARAAPLFHKNASGPGLAAARKVIKKAIKAHATTDNPVLARAVFRASEAALGEKDAQRALERWTELDSKADIQLHRSVDDLRSPEEIALVQGCGELESVPLALACLAKLDPKLAAAKAKKQALLADLYGVEDDPERRSEALKQAFIADPRDPFHAQRYLRVAVAEQEESEWVVRAAVHIPDPPKELTKRQKQSFAKSMDLRAQGYLLAGDGEHAQADFQRAETLSSTPERLLNIGLAQYVAEDYVGALVALSRGLASYEGEDVEAMGRWRQALNSSAEAWPRQMKHYLTEASLKKGMMFESHLLVGEPFPLEGSTQRVVVIAQPKDSAELIERLQGLGRLYEEKSLSFVLHIVSPEEVKLPEDSTVELHQAGLKLMQTLDVIALPAVFIVSEKNKTIGALRPWGITDQSLEKKIDALIK